MRHLRGEIDRLRNFVPPWHEIANLESALTQASAEESFYWRAKSRNDWLLSGDRNTAFFHRSTVARRHFNKIGHLTLPDGTTVSTEEDKAAVTVDFYSNLFTFQSAQSFPEDGLPTLGPPRVTDQMNSQLLQPFTDNDIRKAVFSVGSSKSPGPDGYTGAFYQHFWHIIGSDVCAAVKAFFHSDKMLRSINHTWLTLIPKVSGASCMAQYQPIGLCQMPYKVIAKLLASRLALVLPSIISPTQNGFVANREISDNILIAHEVMHYLRRKKKGKQHFMALKLDMEKAYDRVEWSYLFALMESLGFDTRWIGWIRQCLSTTSFSVPMNGCPSPNFHASRGLRQGDHLSPILFSICTEGLISSLHQSLLSKIISGIRLNRHCVVLSNILFADDTFLLRRASAADCTHLLSILHNYEAISGQRVNLMKSTICFGNNTPESLQAQLGQQLHIPNIGVTDKYLGTPTHFPRSRATTFRFLGRSSCQTHSRMEDTMFISCWYGNLAYIRGQCPSQLRHVRVSPISRRLPALKQTSFALLVGMHSPW
ncbi:Transposon TX1 uncharacterized 149 kDa protein [Linum grandiflorum]